MSSHVTIIAEAGVNHNGDADRALRLVDVAVEAGADYVKFQTFTADRLVTRRAAKADYQIAATGKNESQYEMLRQLELSPEAHQRIIAYCASRGIGFLSTGFDTESVDYLVSVGVGVLKIPSGELTNLPYLRHIGRLGKPVIVSTGMATLGEVGEAIEALELAGMRRSGITVLHCTTEYPTAMCDVNLRAMLTMRDAFGIAVGYSDHTLGIEVPIAAVAMGATLIEKHFTLDSRLPGPDHRASIEPDQLKEMVSSIRNIELALGDGHKIPKPVEEKNRLVARKSLVAVRPIRAGELFSVDNVAAKRPGTGISPMRWDAIIGSAARRDFAEDELLEP